MQFTAIAQIAVHKFVGNHFNDSTAFAVIAKFVADDETNDLRDRAEALRIMADRGMGAGRYSELTDLQLLAAYANG